MTAARDVGLLALRLGVGGTLVAHGTQKLFGWFGGAGLDKTAAAVAGTMIVASSMHAANGFFPSNGGFEFPALLGASAAALALPGPGTLSVDHALGHRVAVLLPAPRPPRHPWPPSPLRQTDRGSIPFRMPPH
jgi:putative oxidoreductase